MPKPRFEIHSLETSTRVRLDQARVVEIAPGTSRTFEADEPREIITPTPIGPGPILLTLGELNSASPQTLIERAPQAEAQIDFVIEQASEVDASDLRPIARAAARRGLNVTFHIR